MSAFPNKHELFLEPELHQYGNHMIMTNVQKQSKFKYVNIDSKFKDEFYENVSSNKNADLSSNELSLSSFTITLPERINEIKSICVTHAEIPMFFYNVSFNLGNSYFAITNSSSVTTVITVPDANYDAASLSSEINTQLAAASISDVVFTVSSNAKTTLTTSSSSGYNIDFDVNSQGVKDQYRFRSKLGYLLGFRKTSYTVNTSAVASVTSEQIVNLFSTKYLYLAVDEYNKSCPSSFLTPLSTSLINKSILARISLNYKDYPFGTMFPVNKSDNLISDVRKYVGSVDLQKLNIKLLDENGNPVILNGGEYSFCLKVEHT
tara:strand:- start:5263 stop:6222 length:960 start_codon:yes stop_codon:yes gene_type:complete